MRPDAADMRVLIVSPHFPPVNAPDMQRVRMSLGYFQEFGWTPYVLAVEPTGEESLDPLLCETIPSSVTVKRVRAVPSALSRRFGIGNVALRAMPFLYAAGSELIAKHGIDLVYFSTTMFLCMPLGRLWRRRFAVPYVLDIQDPWLSDYYHCHPDSQPPAKYWLVRRVHAALEPWTMKHVSGLIAVSDRYVTTLRGRYVWLTADMCTTLPFGASSLDFRLLETSPQPNHSFDRHDGAVHGVYIGRGGDDMKPALRVLFKGLRAAVESEPDAFRRIKLHFVGTDYATDSRARKTVAPIAEELGVRCLVDEHTGRVPYFEALQLMRDADFLILIGSDDPAYTASKVYPYLMAGKPILAVVHEGSGLLPLLQEAAAGPVVGFGHSSEDAASQALVAAWTNVMARLDCPPIINDDVVARYSAREMARRQCVVFDRVSRPAGLETHRVA